MKFCGLIRFTVRVEEYRARVLFLLVQNLVGNSLLGILFLDHIAETILPEHWETLFFKSFSVSVASQRTLI